MIDIKVQELDFQLEKIKNGFSLAINAFGFIRSGYKMALSAFTEESREPTPAELAAVLAESGPLWLEMVAGLEATHPSLEEFWKHGGAKYGWTLRLVRSGKNMVHLTPQQGRFLVGIVLGERAVERARTSGVSKAAIELLDAAPKYAEGRGVRIVVANRADFRIAQELAELKLSTASR